MDVIEAIQARHSIRKFTDEPVNDEDLKTMLRAATLAPNPSNRQPWHFIAVRNRDVLRRMREAVEVEAHALLSLAEAKGMQEEAKEMPVRLAGFQFFETAPVTIAVCERIEPPDTRARLWQAKGVSEAEIDRMRPSRAIQGIGAAIENIALTAVSLGYGSCWMTGPLIAVHQLEEILNVKPPLRLVTMVPIGRPAQTPAPRSRKPLEEVTTIID